ncbi:MAG TPA: hypothetical protein VMJ10_04885, partial [Kofleriaceae bacterium]|nr:hypothetical protein [Kofleriaceae bacterium]
TRWSRYWFADGGRVAAAVVRIAIATAVLMSLWRIAQKVSTTEIVETHALYRPVGVWMLLGHTPPPEALVTALWVLAWAATAAMWLGAATRASTAVSFVASVALASLSFAQSRTWSHQYNVVFLAQLAFLGARGGDTLSVDALVLRLRGKSLTRGIDLPRAYQWSVRLVQLAVALMFAGAAFHKLLHGHFTLRWALSDNLRNQLLVRFDLAALPRPPIVDWIIDDVWRYRTVAVLNLVSQTLPLAACFLMRRPILRALCGAFFVIETIALDQVVALWNPHWLPLAAVFVDWDALVARIARRPPSVPAPPPGWQPRRAIRWFVIAFVAYDALTAFVPTLDQKLNTYPFSSFPMFATVRVRPPYGEHLPYSVAGDHFEVLSDHPIDGRIQRWFDYQHRGMAEVRDPDQLRARLAALLADARERYPEFGIHGVRLYLMIFESPAYPAPAHFEAHPIAILGELDQPAASPRPGAFRTMLGRLDGDLAVPVPRGLDPTGARYVYYRDDQPHPIDMPDGRVGEGDPIFAVAITRDGLPWLVAIRADWRWQ